MPMPMSFRGSLCVDSMASGGPHTAAEVRAVLLRARARHGEIYEDVDDATADADADADGIWSSDELLRAVIAQSRMPDDVARDRLRGCL